jgi:hypothetical protein
MATHRRWHTGACVKGSSMYLYEEQHRSSTDLSTFLQAWPSSTRTLEGLLLGFCEHYSSGTHPEMIVSLGQIGKVRSQFTLAGCTLRTKGLVAMLALSASASSWIHDT